MKYEKKIIVEFQRLFSTISVYRGERSLQRPRCCVDVLLRANIKIVVIDVRENSNWIEVACDYGPTTCLCDD
jgi:hypothetical protein